MLTFIIEIFLVFGETFPGAQVICCLFIICPFFKFNLKKSFFNIVSSTFVSSVLELSYNTLKMICFQRIGP